MVVREERDFPGSDRPFGGNPPHFVFLANVALESIW